MNDFAHGCVPLVFQASLLLALSAVIVQVLIWCLRLTSPTMQRIVWVSILLQGLLLFHLPVKVAWHEAEAATAVSVPVVTVDGSFPDGVPHASSAPLEPTTRPVTADPAPVEPSNPVAPMAPVRRLDGTTILATVWLVGMVGLLGLFGFSYSRVLWRLSRSRSAPEDWAGPWRRLLAEENIRRPIPLLVTERIGPVLCRTPRGYRVFVPQSVWAELTEPQRLAILRHELAHFRRGDLWKTLAVRLVALPHWFNPAAWWAVGRFAECAEWACDEAASGTQPSDGADYATALLRLGSTDVSVASCTTAAGGSSLYHRIRRVVSTPTRKDSLMKRISFFAVAAILLAAAVIRVELVAYEAPEARTEQRMPWSPKELVRVLGDEKGRQWGYIASMDVSPDGKQLATAGTDGNVFLWDATTLALQSMIAGSGKGVFWVSYLPIGQTLVTVSRSEAVRLWDVSGSAPKSIDQLTLPSGHLSSATRSENGQTIAVHTWDETDGQIIILRPEGEQLKQTAVIKLPQRPRTELTPEQKQLAETIDAQSTFVLGGISVMALSPDGNTLAIASGGATVSMQYEERRRTFTVFTDSTIQVWDLSGKKPVLGEATARAPCIASLVFAPDGRTVAAVSADGEVRTWALSDDRFEEPDVLGSVGGMDSFSGGGSLAFSPNGKSLAAAGSGRVMVWDMSDSKRPSRQMDLGSRRSRRVIAFTPDGQSLFVSDGSAIRRWDLTKSETDLAAMTPQRPGGASSLAFVPGSQQLISAGGTNGLVRIWDTGSVDRDEPTSLNVALGTNDKIVVSPDGSRFAFSHSADSNEDSVYSLRVWNWSNGQPRKWATIDLELGYPGSFWSSDFSPDGLTLVTGHRDGNIRAWAIDGSEPRLLATVHGHNNGVCSLHFSRDGGQLASGGWNRSVRLWEIVDGRLQAMRTLGMHEEIVRHVRFSPDEKLLASGDNVGGIKLWNLTLPEPQARVLQSHTAGVTSLRFADDGKTLLTSGVDGRVILWDTATGRPAKEWKFPGAVSCARFSPDGEHIATANGNGSIYILSIPDVKAGQ